MSAETLGLTKLEYFTAAAMTGILSTLGEDPISPHQAKIIAREAVMCARAAFQELEAERGR